MIKWLMNKDQLRKVYRESMAEMLDALKEWQDYAKELEKNNEALKKSGLELADVNRQVLEKLIQAQKTIKEKDREIARAKTLRIVK